MAHPPTVSTLQNQLKRRGVRLNTLHATLRIAELEGARRRKEREQRICKFVDMLGGVREPDLVAISGLTQPTLWRLLAGLQRAGALRVVSSYHDRVPGRRATWLQPLGSPDLDDDRRAALVETAALIKAYIPLWQAERARARLAQQAAEGSPAGQGVAGEQPKIGQPSPDNAKVLQGLPDAVKTMSPTLPEVPRSLANSLGVPPANVRSQDVRPPAPAVATIAPADDGARSTLASSDDGGRQKLSLEVAILEPRPAPETPVSRAPLPPQPRAYIGPPFELPEDESTSPAFPWSFALMLLAAVVILAGVLVLVLHVG